MNRLADAVLNIQDTPSFHLKKIFPSEDMACEPILQAAFGFLSGTPGVHECFRLV